MRRVLPVIPLVLLACDSNKATEPDEVKLSPSLTMTNDQALHNPRAQTGYTVNCFEGATDSPGGGFLGVCQRFKPALDGAEINTMVQGENGSYAGVTQALNYIKGRLIGNVTNLNFSYAGGPHQGGAPRLSIPIDEDGNGTWENFAFIDAPNCNDGDEFVGRVAGKSDQTCTVGYSSETFPNWSAFKKAHPTYRIATNAVTFINVDQPAHYVIWRVQIN